MMKRLFGPTLIEKAFIDSNIDKTHEMVFTKRIVDLANQFLSGSFQGQSKNININININHNTNNQISINISNGSQKSRRKDENKQKREELISIIFKKIRSSSEVQRIKGLIVAHSIIRKVFNEQFATLLAEEIENYVVWPGEEQENEQGRKESGDCKLNNTQKEFIQKNIISFYCRYIHKLIMNIQTYKFAEQYIKGLPKTGFSMIQLINHGFIILNLCNYILQSQFTFNKMGRYYLQYHQMLSLFVMYLNDLIVYNSYIKQISHLSINTFKHASNEEIRHHFLFVTEAQKTSDRLYEFFYNRYYYSQVKKIIMMPTFLSIHNEQYNSLATYVKKNDPQLAQLVKNSKFESNPRGRSRSKTFITEDTDGNMAKLNKTSVLEYNSSSEFDVLMRTMIEGSGELEGVEVKRFTLPYKQ